MECSFDKCDVEFGILNHKYKCEICGNYYCDEHACNASYIKHLRGLKYFELDKVANKNGYICINCFILHGPDDPLMISNIFDRKCYIDGCDSHLNDKLKFKYSCVSCGKLTCSKHSVEREKASSGWLEKHVIYPSGERICTKCLNEKSGQSNIVYHHDALNLKLCAGKPDGERKAVIVHGILADPMNLGWFANTLYRNDLFDSIWLYDDLSYQGRVNEAKRFTLDDIPLGIDLKAVAKNVVKIMGKKALQAIDLPSYIVEGASRTMASTIKLLGWKNVTLLGHSLGGLIVRCASETYKLEEYVNKIITLGSPFQLWNRFHKTKYWNFNPNKNIRYLNVLGGNDYIAAHRSWCDLTQNDEKLKNVLKVIIPKLDHSTIYERIGETYFIDFMNGFLNETFFCDKTEFYLREDESNLKVHFQGLHGQVNENDQCIYCSGEWLEFKNM